MFRRTVIMRADADKSINDVVAAQQRNYGHFVKPLRERLFKGNTNGIKPAVREWTT